MKINKKRISRKFIRNYNKAVIVINILNERYEIDWDKFVQSCSYNPSLKKKYIKECKLESAIGEVTFKTFSIDELFNTKEN